MANCIISIFTNFVPNKTIICKDKYRPWMDSDIKLACQNKASIYKRYVIFGRNIADHAILPLIVPILLMILRLNIFTTLLKNKLPTYRC